MRRAQTFGAVLGLLVTGGACSLALDFLECRDSADCANEDGTALVCRDNECIVPPDPATVECSTAAQCVDALGEDHICVAGQGSCAALTSEQCTTVVAPDGVSVDKLVWLGAIQTTTPPFDTLGVSLQNAILLAAADFNSVAKVGSDNVGLILCDSRGKPSLAAAAADHLIAAGVRAIVGPTQSEEVVEVAKRSVGADVFVMSPTATAQGITALDDNDLVWRDIASDVHQANALVDLISLLDPDPKKVVLFVKNDDHGNGILGAITDPLLVRLPAGGLVTLKYSDPASFKSNDALLEEYGSRIATAISATPDTIVVAGTNEARELILFYLDTWSDIEPLPPLPRFIVTHGAIPEMKGIVDAVAESFRPALMRNVMGVAPVVQDDDNFDAYDIRYKIRFDGQQAGMYSGLAYDAAMVSMLAMAAAGTGATGTDIAAQIPRMVDPMGVPISFGGAGVKFITDAAGSLLNGGTVNLQGVSGALDFDLATGDVRTDVINWGLVPRAGTTSEPVLTPLQVYVLDPPPAAGGDWMPLP